MEASPEFQKALNEACEKQYRGWLFGGEYRKTSSRDKIGETLEEIEAERKRLMEKHEGYMRQAKIVRDQAKLMRNPHMREINEMYRRKYGSGGLICPICGGGNHGNTINGKPVCMMNAKHKGLGSVPLMSPEKAKDWTSPPKKSKPRELWELDDSEIVRMR